MDDVHLVDYGMRWPALYAAEAARMQVSLPAGLVHAVEHFGSTAIPGVVAKPVIDILVAVRSASRPDGPAKQARKHSVLLTRNEGAVWRAGPKPNRFLP